MKKKLRRSRDQMIAGVCAGLAEYLDIDVTLARVGYVLLSILSAGFPGTLLYIILWIVMPKAVWWTKNKDKERIVELFNCWTV